MEEVFYAPYASDELNADLVDLVKRKRQEWERIVSEGDAIAVKLDEWMSKQRRRRRNRRRKG